MTTDDLLRELKALVKAGRHQEALDLAGRALPQIRPTITSEQVVRIAELTHVAQMAVDLEDWGTTRPSMGANAKTPPARSA